jgi:hypothetical protein
MLRLAVKENLSRIRLDKAAQDMHQRTLSRPVFPGNRVQLALLQRKVHTGQRVDTVFAVRFRYLP